MYNKQTPLKWGIMGAGNIAGAFANGLKTSKTGRLTAVGSRSMEKAAAFAAKHAPDATSFGDYQALLDSDTFDAVYIATPHPEHVKWAIRAAKAGKHILCEKPAGMNYAEVLAMVDAARTAGVFFMEAFMYRCHPIMDQLREKIASGAIGEVRALRAAFSFSCQRNLEGRLLNRDLGGGGILDVGCYPVSFARMIAGAMDGKPFADPVDVAGFAHIPTDSRVDEWASATLKFSNGLVASVSCGVQLNLPSEGVIYGSEGSIEFTNPWIPSRNGGAVSFTIHAKDGKVEETVTASLPEGEAVLYGCEADTVAAHIDDLEAPAMSGSDSLGNARALDKWRRSVKLEYPGESLIDLSGPYDGPLTQVHLQAEYHAKVAGVEKPVSRLVIGSIGFESPAQMAMMYDRFFEKGGNAIDTSWHYGFGKMDTMIGAWLRSRDVREQVVIIAKGAHTPWCTPENFKIQLDLSLGYLGTEYADIYMLHRDNTEIPVGEFVDAMEVERLAGRIRSYGGSNWSRERVDEANEYAARVGAMGFTVLSNQFSLARMVNPVWKGCLAASSAEDRAWLEERKISLMPWSSQARGFFTDRSGPDQLGDKELADSWYSDDNWKRKSRCFELAKHLGVSPVTIAAAYVLSQPFATFPLIGPVLPWEMDDSFAALEIQLDIAHCSWLNLETEERPF